MIPQRCPLGPWPFVANVTRLSRERNPLSGWLWLHMKSTLLSLAAHARTEMRFRESQTGWIPFPSSFSLSPIDIVQYCNEHQGGTERERASERERKRERERESSQHRNDRPGRSLEPAHTNAVPNSPKPTLNLIF